MEESGQTGTADRTGSLQTVANALAVLEILGKQGPEIGVADVSRHLNVPRSTAYRLLNTLERYGFADQNPDTKKYRLGLKIFELAGTVTRNLGLNEIARPLIEQLVWETQETVRVSVLDRGECLVIEKADGPRDVFLRAHVGSRQPLHCTATGKIFLAFQEPAVIEQVLGEGLRRYTSATETDPQRLRAELDEIRKVGYAFNWGGYREDAAGVAAPIRDRSGRVVAAVGVAAPIGRLTHVQAQAVLGPLLRCATAISRRLGWWADGEDAVPPLPEATAAAPAPSA